MTREQNILLDGLKMVSQIFWGPSGDRCVEMVEEDYLVRLEELTAVIDEKSRGNLRQILSVIRSFKDGDSLCEYLEPAYVRLFISAKEGIPAPLYESCYEYENAPLMGKPASAMKERFEAKGLSIADEILEPPDHVSIELEYLYFLLGKGWNDKDEAYITEASAFASDVMLPWVSKLSKRLASEKECRFYPLSATVLMGILTILGDVGRF
ncbi:MAG: molecular chaperone TorD family protein [Deltaproteobacteria bacterium]|nr:MAG: molecular chaperone TorD family protein [Deltaproteobacteria bacterium]